MYSSPIWKSFNSKSSSKSFLNYSISPNFCLQSVYLQGFTPELIRDLNYSSQLSGEAQMKYLLEKMLERKEVTAADVLSRANFIISGLFLFFCWFLFFAGYATTIANLIWIFSFWSQWWDRQTSKQTIQDKAKKKCSSHSLTTKLRVDGEIKGERKK